MLNLDTHILLHALGGGITASERKLLDNNSWSISAIVLWEIAKLAELNKISIDLNDAEIVRTLSRIHTWPLTLEICRETQQLDFDSDPEDELIAATSIVHRVPLLTRDKKILKSKITPFP